LLGNWENRSVSAHVEEDVHHVRGRGVEHSIRNPPEKRTFGGIEIEMAADELPVAQALLLVGQEAVGAGIGRPGEGGEERAQAEKSAAVHGSTTRTSSDQGPLASAKPSTIM